MTDFLFLGALLIFIAGCVCGRMTARAPRALPNPAARVAVEPTRLIVGHAMFVTDVDGTVYVGDNRDAGYRSSPLPYYMQREDGNAEMSHDCRNRLQAYFRAQDLREHATRHVLKSCND